MTGYGERMIKGEKIRLLGLCLLILPIVSTLSTIKTGIAIFILEILLIGLTYFCGAPKVSEKIEEKTKKLKKQEFETYIELGRGILKLFLILGLVFGLLYLVVLIISKLIAV